MSEDIKTFDALSDNQEAELVRLENAVDSHLASWQETAIALYKIRDEKLFRRTAPTFSGYAEIRFKISPSKATRYADAGKVLTVLSGSKTPPYCEYQCRPLAQLDPDQIKKVWTAVLKSSKDVEITTELIESKCPQHEGGSNANPHWIEIAQEDYRQFRRINNQRAASLEAKRLKEAGTCIATVVKGSTIYCVSEVEGGFKLVVFSLDKQGEWVPKRSKTTDNPVSIIKQLGKQFDDLVPVEEVELQEEDEEFELDAEAA